MSSVQEHYTQYVTSGGDGLNVLDDRGVSLGYQDDWRPDEIRAECFVAFCGSGCPLRLLPPGQLQVEDDLMMMDLGCGAGHDALLAAAQLSATNTNNTLTSRVVGVDFTEAMIQAAEANANKYPQWKDRIEFVQADFVHDTDNKLAKYHGQVDLIISNGVFNLCRDKVATFQAVYNLLKPGGQLVFSDVMKLDTVNEHAKIATSINGDVFSS